MTWNLQLSRGREESSARMVAEESLTEEESAPGGLTTHNQMLYKSIQDILSTPSTRGRCLHGGNRELVPALRLHELFM